MKAVLLFIWLLLVLIAGPIWGGYVLSVMWAWFVVPTFHAPQVSVAVAVGISLIVGMLTKQVTESQEKKDATASVVSSFTWSFFYPLLILGVGYVAHMFV